jgi:hypothetical protein
MAQTGTGKKKKLLVTGIMFHRDNRKKVSLSRLYSLRYVVHATDINRHRIMKIHLYEREYTRQV